MDAKFHSAMEAARAGRVEEFIALLDRGPDLATARSNCSHPTLLQFLVLDGSEGRIAQPDAFMSALVERGADLNEPMVAAASVGSESMVSSLLAAGASVEAGTPWTPLEESVYWAHSQLSLKLRSAHGARVLSLRAAAGLGDLAEMARFLDGDRPNVHAGPVRYPWGTPSIDSQDVLDQALVIATRNGQENAARRLLDCGADIDAFPPGIHERGGALHMAALCGHRELVLLFLEAGADPTRLDPEHQSDPAGWAQHGGHPDIAAMLRTARGTH